jgi:hypothetical protein
MSRRPYQLRFRYERERDAVKTVSYSIEKHRNQEAALWLTPGGALGFHVEIRDSSDQP